MSLSSTKRYYNLQENADITNIFLFRQVNLTWQELRTVNLFQVSQQVVRELSG